MADYLLQESGFRIALEDGLGFLLLESSTGAATDHSTVRLARGPVESVVQLGTPALSVALLEDPHDEVKL